MFQDVLCRFCAKVIGEEAYIKTADGLAHGHCAEAAFQAAEGGGPVRPKKASRPTLTSIVFRIRKSKLDALQALAKRTRIRQSEYLREAIADLIAKYEEK